MHVPRERGRADRLEGVTSAHLADGARVAGAKASGTRLSRWLGQRTLVQPVTLVTERCGFPEVHVPADLGGCAIARLKVQARSDESFGCARELLPT